MTYGFTTATFVVTLNMKRNRKKENKTNLYERMRMSDIYFFIKIHKSSSVKEYKNQNWHHNEYHSPHDAPFSELVTKLPAEEQRKDNCIDHALEYGGPDHAILGRVDEFVPLYLFDFNGDISVLNFEGIN